MQWPEGRWRYALDILVMLLTAATLFVGHHLWTDHTVFHQMVLIEAQRQQRAQAQAQAPAQPQKPAAAPVTPPAVAPK